MLAVKSLLRVPQYGLQLGYGQVEFSCHIPRRLTHQVPLSFVPRVVLHQRTALFIELELSLGVGRDVCAHPAVPSP